MGHLIDAPKNNRDTMRTSPAMTTDILIDGTEFTVKSGQYPKHDRFWKRVNRGYWETDTFRVIDQSVDTDTLAIDCGAWIGPTVLYTAQRAGLCVAFEPDPVAHGTLVANLELNQDQPWADRIRVFNQAIHPSGEPITISANGEGGDSMTSALYFERATSWSVTTRRLQDVIKEFRGDYPKVFIKIDVEGGEYEILPAISDILRDQSFSFLISFHHRHLKHATYHERESEQEAEAEFVRKLQNVVEALPWGRKICNLEGEELRHRKALRVTSRGRSFAKEVFIS